MAEHSFGRAGQKFTVADWRSIFGGEPGIVGDVDGSAYKLTLPTGTDDAVLGSATQDSTSIVGGALHQIAAGQTQTVNIPASSNAANGRTDIIAVRYDLATFTTDPGPCRLVRIAGVEGSTALPSLDEAPPGVEDMPLWAVTRKQGQSLNQASARDLRRRMGPNLLIPSGESLPQNVPLGTRARRGTASYIRGLASNGSATWFTLYDYAPPAGPAHATYTVGTADIGSLGTWATLEVADPGYPYYLDVAATGEWTQVSGRHDFAVRVGSASGPAIATTINLPTGGGFKSIRTPVATGSALNTPFTGPRTLYAVAYRVTSAGTGRFGAGNGSLVARVVPA